MRIVMVGTGYVGLVSGACLADFGHTVTCVDKDEKRITALRRGKVPFFEPGLEGVVENNLKQKRLKFTTDLSKAVQGAEAIFIAVGTPARNNDGHVDISFVYQAAREIGRALTGYTVIIMKSTVPVGIGDEVELAIREVQPDAKFSVVSNPEFLREGAAIRDFKVPDRIIVGTEDAHARAVLSEIYRPLIDAGPILYTGRRNAELIKYAANAFLATKITFINEIADLCEKVGGDVEEVARGMGMDRRIGESLLSAGPGYGGSCFPKDTMALVKTGYDHGAPLRLVESVSAVNENRKRTMARKVLDAVGGNLRGRRVGVLGLTFKPNTDDMRDAPSIVLITALQDMGARVVAYDPEGMTAAKSMLTDVQFAKDEYSCAEGADALVVVTEWEQFRALQLDQLRSVMAAPVIVDLRNLYDLEDMRKHGFSYYSVGRRPVRATLGLSFVNPEPIASEYEPHNRANPRATVAPITL